MAHAPKLTVETFQPVRPNSRYCIGFSFNPQILTNSHENIRDDSCQFVERSYDRWVWRLPYRIHQRPEILQRRVELQIVRWPDQQTAALPDRSQARDDF